MSRPTELTERERVLFLSVVRAACLADHMGDMWNALHEVAGTLGIELPEDDDGDVDLEAVEQMGGRGVWTDPKLADYLGGNG